MKTLFCFLREFILQEDGAVAAEYAVLIGCIAAVIAGSVTYFGGAVQKLYQDAVDKFPR